MTVYGSARARRILFSSESIALSSLRASSRTPSSHRASRASCNAASRSSISFLQAQESHDSANTHGFFCQFPCLRGNLGVEDNPRFPCCPRQPLWIRLFDAYPRPAASSRPFHDNLSQKHKSRNKGNPPDRNPGPKTGFCAPQPRCSYLCSLTFFFKVTCSQLPRFQTEAKVSTDHLKRHMSISRIVRPWVTITQSSYLVLGSVSRPFPLSSNSLSQNCVTLSKTSAELSALGRLCKGYGNAAKSA